MLLKTLSYVLGQMYTEGGAVGGRRRVPPESDRPALTSRSMMAR